MQHVLAVSASAQLQSVAVFRAGGRVALQERPFRRRQPRELLAEIERALAQAELSLSDLTLLVGDVGPGSFTGIRAGLATLRGLSFALGCPVAAVTALDLVRAAAGRLEVASTVALAGRAGTYFVAHYPPGDPRPSDAPVSERVGLPPAQAGRTLLVAGPNAHSLGGDAAADGAPGLRAVLSPHVDAVAALLPHLVPGPWQTLAPQYVAASDAELNVGVRVYAAAIPATRR